MFDIKKFKKTKFEPRTELVPLPDMKEFFGEGDEPVWKVRGLTGAELGRCTEAAERNKNIAAILEGLISPDNQTKVESVREMIGMTPGTVPNDIARRIEQLVLGSVDPAIDEEMAVKLCQVYPVEFYQLTNAIVRLTGAGHVPGKQKPSGTAQKSGEQCTSATPEGASSTK